MSSARTLPVIFAIFSGISLVSHGEESPITFGNELHCVGEIEGTGDERLRVILYNDQSELTAPSEENGRAIKVALKSALKGGRWFYVQASEGAADGQVFRFYRENGERREILAEGTYGASLALSSGAPKLNILNPAIKFEILMTLNAANEIQMDGYLAIRIPNAEEVIVAPQMECRVQAVSNLW